LFAKPIFKKQVDSRFHERNNRELVCEANIQETSGDLDAEIKGGNSIYDTPFLD
jgi:hypothetical protein